MMVAMIHFTLLTAALLLLLLRATHRPARARGGDPVAAADRLRR
jgi:hypothetical protein